MLILLYSDTNYVLNGFRAEYFISNWYVLTSKKNVCSNIKNKLILKILFFIFILVQIIVPIVENVLAINVYVKVIG